MLLSHTFFLCSSITFLPGCKLHESKTSWSCLLLSPQCWAQRRCQICVKKRIRGQIYAYHRVRHVTSDQSLPWLLCEATLNIIAIGRSVFSSSNLGQESSVELHLQLPCSCWSMISATWNGMLHRFPQSSIKREVQLFRILSLNHRREDTISFDSTPILIHSVYQSASKLVGIYWAPSGSKVVLWLSNWVWNINHMVKPKLNPQVVESAIQVVRFSSCRLYFVMMSFYFLFPLG